MTPKPTPSSVEPSGHIRSAWDQDLIRSALDGLDEIAARHERVWGAGRLRLLVDTELRARFDRQTERVNGLIWSDLSARDVVPHVEALGRGWVALDRAARAAGHAPLPPEVWETRGDDGRVVAVVRDNADAWLASCEALAQGRAVAVYTMAEVARLLLAHRDIVRVKAEFPGSVIESVQTPRAAPPMDWAKGDLLPI
jgi:hypothetical protein